MYKVFNLVRVARNVATFSAFFALAIVLRNPGEAVGQVKTVAAFETVSTRFDAPPVHAFQQDQEQELSADERMTTSGFFLGIVGMLGGAALGSGVGSAHCGSDCVTDYAAGGASVMGSVLVPVGVQVVSEGKGNLLMSLGGSAGIGVLSWALFNNVPGQPVALAPFVAAPVQVWLSSKIARR